VSTIEEPPMMIVALPGPRGMGEITQSTPVAANEAPVRPIRTGGNSVLARPRFGRTGQSAEVWR
jgi:hypothetical protein